MKRSLLSDVLALSIPAFINTALTSMFVIIDAIMVGELGPYAIAAVGIVKQPLLLLNLAMIGFSMATTTLIAHEKGRGDREQANKVLAQGLTITLAVSLIPLVLGLLFSTPIVNFMGASADTSEPASTYLRIVLLGFVFHALATTMGNAFKGAGNTAILLYSTLFSNVVNIVLNYALITGHWGCPALGIRGAAIATAASHVTSFVILTALLFSKKFYISLDRHTDYRFDRSMAHGFLSLGLPIMERRAATRFGMLVMVRFVAPLGTAVMAS